MPEARRCYSLFDYGSLLTTILSSFILRTNAYYALGMPNATKVTLQTGQFEFSQLWALARVTDQNHGSGIYLNLYRNISRANSGSQQHALYVGKTVDFAQRMAAHDAKIANPPTSGGYNHYKIASLAEAHKTIVLAQFPRDLVDFELVLKFAEHCFVSLLDTWNPLVRSPPKSTTEFCRGGGDTQAAARDTFQKIKWPMSTPFRGCNWKTPITEGGHKSPIPWTSLLYPDTAEVVPKDNIHGLPPTKMRIFFRQPTKTMVCTESSGTCRVRIFGSHGGGLSITVPKETGVKVGQTV